MSVEMLSEQRALRRMKKVIVLKKKYRLVPVVALTLLLMSLCACSDGGQQEAPQTPHAQSTQTEPSSGEVVVTFDYERQSGSASNQYAIWVEDMNGNYINTIYATKWTADGGFKSRPDSIAMWVEKSEIAAMPDYYVDAVSGATPRASGSQSYAWNLMDVNGEMVSPGEYMILVEGTLRWKNRVLHSCEIMIGDTPATASADAEYVYEASDRQAALTDISPENAMIGAVTVSYAPIVDN